MKKHIALLAAFLLSVFAVSAQISPGDLSNAHAYLEGVSNCTKCHSVGNKVTNDNCLACHPIIRNNQATRKGYHGSVDVMGKNCYSCHNEHHGRKFRLIDFNKNTFDHRKTGFERKGVHATLDCQKCHNPEHISDPKLKKKKSTYLGLNKTCLTCQTITIKVKCPPIARNAIVLTISRIRKRLTIARLISPCSANIKRWNARSVTRWK